MSKARSRLTTAEHARAVAISRATGHVFPSFSTPELCIAGFEGNSTPGKEIVEWETTIEAVAATCAWHACGRPENAAETDPLALLQLAPPGEPLSDAVIAACVVAPVTLLKEWMRTVLSASSAPDSTQFWERLLHGAPNAAQHDVVVFLCNACVEAEKRHADEFAHVTEVAKAALVFLRTCARCGHKSHILQSCALCHEVFYCDKECQKLHWRAGHKQACAGRAEQAAGAGATGGTTK